MALTREIKIVFQTPEVRQDVGPIPTVETDFGPCVVVAG